VDIPVRIRDARREDRNVVAEFTASTFPWGDYVADRFLDWLEEPDGRLLVAVDPTDRPVGVIRVELLSPEEAWLHAARVHPDHRRMGIGTALNRAACRWAAEQGALIVRLLVENWNTPARSQVTKLGFSPAASWVWGEKSIADGAPRVRANGGRRVPSEERLVRSSRSEAEPAWMAYSTGPLAAAAKMLKPFGWSFRTMRYPDVVEAAEEGRLWQCPSGWVIADPTVDGWQVSWLVTTDLDADRIVRALDDRAAASGVRNLLIWVPEVPWAVEALERASFSLHPATVYARPL
jgi:GNAT superfamily N-acetyltransferase